LEGGKDHSTSRAGGSLTEMGKVAWNVKEIKKDPEKIYAERERKGQGPGGQTATEEGWKWVRRDL